MVRDDDVYEMWMIRHWRIGMIGNAYRTRREAKEAAIGTLFLDAADYRRNVGKLRPYKMIKVDVSARPKGYHP